MEGKLISAVAGDGEKRGMSDMDDYLKEQIFKKLPLISIIQIRLVCKQWNEILSSRKFLSSLPEQNPWLLIFGEDYCISYCFSTKKWRAISLSFLPPTLQNNFGLYMKSSTALGLLAFFKTHFDFLKKKPELYLCNPLMRICSRTEIWMTENFYVVHGTNAEPYLLEEENKKSLQIYHYCQDSWEIKHKFAKDLDLCPDEMVECKGVIFWRTSSPAIVDGFSMEVDCIKPVRMAPPPSQFVEDDYKTGTLFKSIVAYGSSVLLVTLRNEYEDEIEPLRMVIWELFEDKQDNSLWKWKELVRMSAHDSLPQVFCGDKRINEGITVGNYLCLRFREPYSHLIVANSSSKRTERLYSNAVIWPQTYFP
ncbi:F-box/kelch-repeat protein At5g15710-like [Cryptomeria japonica]|uniref:F-box/kelch-repeat protein At5g15710-like n=1 Tax=Cryptomeria japonica TaxID=3369 RepID=UPI0027DA2F04|nr:F-box/kelch-repeat protein At5g15710-like [Cryptomeria japonica]